MQHTETYNTHKDRIAFLDHLRIFAFVSVFIGHKFYAQIESLASNSTIHASLKLILSLLLPLFKGGGAGVVIFFLISGYVITHVLQTEKTGTFLIKRIFRIYPLYITAVLIQITFVSEQPIHPTILIQQLLLIGDFFGTPYSLGGVEWTLRIEILFYIYMATLKKLDVIKKYQILLPYAYLLTIILCFFMAPIPVDSSWSKGYLTIYSPFLLLGSMIYLYERKTVNLSFFLLFIMAIFFHYFTLIQIFQPEWLNAHFALLAFLIFFTCWSLRKTITASYWVLIVSEMAYAVYLLHNWLFDFIVRLLQKFNIVIFNAKFEAVILLSIVCFILVKTIEKPGIQIGKILLKKIYANRA